MPVRVAIVPKNDHPPPQAMETCLTEIDHPQAAVEAGPRRLRYSDADFLRIVDDECRRSVGFGEGDTGELARVRIKAQEYRQGRIVDLPAIRGRSTAVDSTLADAVDTLMPDVMEVFFGGDDVVTFQADGAADEAQAREETDVVTHVVFHQNDAFRAFHDAIQDALLNRTGLFHWWWEEDEKALASHETGGLEEAAAVAALAQLQRSWTRAQLERREDGSVAVKVSELRGRVCIKAVPSEDFTVAADAIALRDAAYCALRDRPRVQELIARGVDGRLARSLPHATSRQDAIENARDEAGENDRAGESGIDDLRVVEVRTHYLRIDADDDGDVEIWRIETDAEQRVLLQKERVSQIPFGALTPYLSAHRFYGESLADKLFEVMRIKTVLLRMLLDSGYFALNQRMEVSEEQASEFTIADLLNNAPNVPVRSKTGQAVRPISGGGLGFDVFAAMEFMSTVAEQRSGVVRNAQGLNPDTLHETASGAMQLIAAAQKRVRMICRVFAETGVKDLFLGVHQLLREAFTRDHAPARLKVGQVWREVRPEAWCEREALSVHVGVGSSGRDRDLAVQSQAIGLTEKVVQLQGGIEGPFVTAQNVYNRLRAFSRAVGEKSPDLYWSDPAHAPEMGEHHDPEAQLEMARLNAKAAADGRQAQVELQIARERMAAEMALKREEMQLKIQLERERAAEALKLQREELTATLALKGQALASGASASVDVAGHVADLPGGLG
jgi:hypothetical protein